MQSEPGALLNSGAAFPLGASLELCPFHPTLLQRPPPQEHLGIPLSDHSLTVNAGPVFSFWFCLQFFRDLYHLGHMEEILREGFEEE